MTDAQPNLASELIYQRVREKVDVGAIAVLAGELVRAQLTLGKNATDAVDMFATVWSRITSDLESVIMEIMEATYGATEAERTND